MIDLTEPTPEVPEGPKAPEASDAPLAPLAPLAPEAAEALDLAEAPEEPEMLEAPEVIEDLFQIDRDEIPSFGFLQQKRASAFSSHGALESFKNRVHELGGDGEAGRRRGLGQWMAGLYSEAADQLASYESDDVASFTRATALMSLGRPQEAMPIYERLSNKYPDEPRPRGGWIEARLEAALASGDAEAAQQQLDEVLATATPAFLDSAEGHYLQGRTAQMNREWQLAIDHYSAAMEADPTHRANLFRLGYLAERNGLDDLALEAYETLTSQLPADRVALMNLGVLYEDFGRDQEAAACFDTVSNFFPTDKRARLYLADAIAGMEMYYDEDQEKKEDKLNQILRIPITDFELSVRSRNSLNKMNILTLGDLVKKTEAELLAVKNFGETSLNEIKEILSSKGLRLGMNRKEAAASIARRTSMSGSDEAEASSSPVSVLKLSIRARRVVENLGALTLHDICQHSEEELLSMPNFGATSLLELKNKLKEQGLDLKKS